MVTKEDVSRLLKELDIKPDDVVTIHSSLRAIGEIENGADGLIDFFCEYLGDGLFIVPTHTWANVTKENPFFDVKKTEPCIGTLPKIAAFRKDGVRSLHPTHSMAVFGKEAKEYVRGEEKSTTPAPCGGALSRLCENNGKILLVGVGQERNTFIHAVDEMVGVPNRLSNEPFDVIIRDHDGKEHKVSGFRGHMRDFSIYFPNYKTAFEFNHVVKYSKLGNAQVCCCDARGVADVLKKIWQRTDHDLCERLEIIPEKYYNV